MKHHLTRIDTTLSQKVQLRPRSRRWKLARLLAHSGDGPVVFSLLGLVYLIGWLGDLPALCRADAIIAAITLAAMAVVTLIKFAVQRQRPQPPGEFVSFAYDAYSFPSGHSGRMAAVATGAFLFNSLIGAVLLAVACCVAAARVMVGVHYVSDIVAGLAVGALVALAGGMLL